MHLLCMHSTLHVPGSTTGQLGASCTPSTALAWLWSTPGSSSMCAAQQLAVHSQEDDLEACSCTRRRTNSNDDKSDDKGGVERDSVVSIASTHSDLLDSRSTWINSFNICKK
eukprot:651483-Pelagomonas_calceolata.AAC.10